MAEPQFVSGEVGTVDASTVVITFDQDVMLESDYPYGGITGRRAGYKSENIDEVYKVPHVKRMTWRP